MIYKNINKAMKQLRLLLLIFLIILSVSCATAPIIPEISSQAYIPLNERLPYKIALIITDEFKNAVYSGVVNTKLGCNDNEVGGNSKWSIGFDSNVGTANQELFVNGLSNLFNKVDVYKNITEIKNKNYYDYILIPNSIVTTYYTNDEYRPGANTISASVEYQLKEMDPENYEMVETFTSEASSQPTSVGGSCIGFFAEIVAINKGYQKSIGEAMNKAFDALLQNVMSINESITAVTRRILHIISTKHYRRIAILPSISEGSDEVKMITSLEVELHRMNISIVNKDLIKKALSDLNQSNARRDKKQTAKIIGNLTGADVILISNIKIANNKTKIESTLIDTESGREYSITAKAITNEKNY
jgi:hypothetical protein